ncbi:MAG: energy transducer TonB [Sphingobium sp.]
MTSGPSEATRSAQTSRYEPKRFEPRAVLLVFLIQGALLTALVTYRFPVAQTVVQRPLVVHSIDLTPPPPAEPEMKSLPDPRRPAVEVHAPRPMIEMPASTPPLMVTVSEPIPVQPADPAQTSAVPPSEPARPIAAANLSASMIHAPPPRYPRESRRLREQGTVVLELLLSAEGRVRDIRVLRSSGYARLDDAARSAVSRWRWSPTVVSGVAVQVRGNVEIPFILSNRDES